MGAPRGCSARAARRWRCDFACVARPYPPRTPTSRVRFGVASCGSDRMEDPRCPFSLGAHVVARSSAAHEAAHALSIGALALRRIVPTMARPTSSGSRLARSGRRSKPRRRPCAHRADYALVSSRRRSIFSRALLASCCPHRPATGRRSGLARPFEGSLQGVTGPSWHPFPLRGASRPKKCQ
jgi:hypothetical protein